MLQEKLLEKVSSSKAVNSPQIHTFSAATLPYACVCFVLCAPLFCIVNSYSSLKTQLRHASFRKPSLPLTSRGRKKHLELILLKSLPY